MINGNITATFQVKSSKKNIIGEKMPTWKNKLNILGWLDYASGSNELSKYNAKVQESTHIFLCDYDVKLNEINAENSRCVINDNIYQVLMIDNPMQMNEHCEIYLKYVGGGLSVG